MSEDIDDPTGGPPGAASPFDHVILTRFSVRMGPVAEFSDEWLAYRWGFFRDALVASLRAQTVRDFTWLVFFDDSAPEWLRDLVAEVSPGLFTPIWLDEPWGHAPIRRAVIAVASRPYLITTRIDSDDAVSRYFVEDVQSRFDGQDELYVNLLRGVQVDRSRRLFGAAFVENAFISLIEKRVPGTEPLTVFRAMPHEESSSFGPVLNVIGPPRWMQVIHGSNLANSVRGVLARPDRIIDDFAVDFPVERAIGTGQFVVAWGASVGRLLRLWVRHPNLAVVRARAVRLRLRGTTVVPQHVHRESRVVTGARRVWRRLHGRTD